MKPSISFLDSLNEDYNNLSPMEIIEQSINDVFKNEIAYVCSFGTESAIILHMISKTEKNLPIILINTNFLFDETLKYKNYLLKKLSLKNFIEIFPDKTDLYSEDNNNILWRTDQDRCCNIRKVLPLQKELKKYKAWISGRKSYHNGERRSLKPTEILNRKIVVNPLANIKKDFVDSYFEKENIDRHPLFEKGYLSIGCIHCTQKAINPNDPRSGRWSDKIKTECGIHYDLEK